MSGNSKAILVVGLGGFASPELFTRIKEAREAAAAEVKKANNNGFVCKTVDVDPDDAAGSLERVKETLKSQHWDGLSIGYGVRAMKEYTPMFQDIVNASREISPQTKLVFNNGPDRIFDALQSAFPDRP